MQKRPDILRKSKGFSLIELVVAMSSAAILLLSIAVFLSNSQRNWNDLFQRVYSPAATDGFVAQKVFDTICRKASMRKVLIEDDGQTLELYYWDEGSSALTPENYARFYQADDKLYLSRGKMQTGTWQPDTGTAGSPILLTEGIEDVTFQMQGASIEMFLTYADNESMPIVCSTVRHNE